MKLSIHIILDRLAEKVKNCRLYGNEDVTLNLQSVRYYTPSSVKLMEDTLYIITADELTTIESKKSLSFICIGEIEEKLLKSKVWSLITVPKGISKSSIQNDIQTIFDEYNQWTNHLNTLIFSENSMQSIFDLCSIYLKNPIALFDNAKGLLMTSGPLDTENADYLWSFILKKGHSMRETEEEFIKNKIVNSYEPFYYRSPDTLSHINRLAAPIRIHHKLFGLLAMSDTNQPFTHSEYAHLVIISRVMENALSVSKEYLSSSEMPWYLNRILLGQKIDSNLLSHYLSINEVKIDQPFFLWCFCPLAGGESSAENYVSFLKRRLQTNLIYIYENNIIVFDYQPENQQNSKNLLFDYTYQSNLLGVTSMTYHHSLDAHCAYRQCLLVLERVGQDNSRIYDFSDFYDTIIIEHLRNLDLIESLIYPDLRKLELEEDPYHKELLHFLQVYILRGQNLSATAKTLNLHRQTAIYRLNKICDMTGMNFEYLTEASRFQIYFSCRLLLGADPQ